MKNTTELLEMAETIQNELNDMETNFPPYDKDLFKRKVNCYIDMAYRRSMLLIDELKELNQLINPVTE